MPVPGTAARTDKAAVSQRRRAEQSGVVAHSCSTEESQTLRLSLRCFTTARSAPPNIFLGGNSSASTFARSGLEAAHSSFLKSTNALNLLLTAHWRPSGVPVLTM